MDVIVLVVIITALVFDFTNRLHDDWSTTPRSLRW